MVKLFFRTAAGIGLLFLIVTFTPIVNIWATWLAGPWRDLRGDCLIVLAGSATGGGVIGESSYWRAVYAGRIWQEGGFRRLILSGPSDITEPMRRFLVFSAVPGDAIQIEPESRNTHENAVNVRRLVKVTDGQLVLLTSDYHMFRAAAAFRKAGVVFKPAPIPDALKRGQSLASRWSVFLDLCIETAKIIDYRGRGWM